MRAYNKARQDVIDTLIHLLYHLEAESGKHCHWIVNYAVMTTRKMGLSGSALKTIHYGTLLHDIGKLGVPAAILRKPGKLTPNEWQIVKSHPQMGADLLAPYPFLASVSRIVVAHHERYDGNGYPNNLHGNSIPIGARIVSVADAYCAMIENRPYTQPKSTQAALNELIRCAGTQFDPQVVSAFSMVMNPTSQEPSEKTKMIPVLKTDPAVL